MKTRLGCLLLVILFLEASSAAAEPLNIAESYQRISGDYQRVAGGSAATRAAAGRLAKDAYRLLVEQAKGVAKPSAEDLYALGGCHEALGDEKAARDQYAKSLAAKPEARTHLALVRLSLATDPAGAEKSLAEAAKLQPDHPELWRARLALAAAYTRQRAWGPAIAHLDKHLAYTKSVLDRQPGSRAVQSAHAAAQRNLDLARRYAGMTGKPAPAIKVSAWAHGAATDLAALKGKVVVLDFLAVWAESNRQHLDGLPALSGKGVEVVALTQANHHQYDAATDSVTVVDDLSLEDEAAGLAAFAKKHGTTFRLGIIDKATIEQYGVVNLPHVVVIDKAGNVSAILLGEHASGAELDKAIAAAGK